MANKQLPITNYQLTITNHQSPITNYQSPITNPSLIMASSYSFDIVSDFDRQELVNAIDQVQRELKGRYDLKDTKTTVELSEENIVVNTDSEFTLNSVQDIIREKAAKRNLSQKIFDFGTIESSSGNRVRQEIKLQKGISQEIGKKISKLIRDEFKKVQASIQGDAVRVSAKSKDELQTVIQRLKQKDIQEDLPVALQFNNYR
jgi:cyclic-di-GMP-binding protein